MKFKVLASGSKGNSTFVQINNSNFLIDCGISYTKAKTYLEEDNIDINSIDGIFITHEHIDHIKEVVMFLKKIKCKLYITKASFDNIRYDIKNMLNNYDINFIEENTIYHIGSATIYTLLLSHDAKKCLGYIFEEDASDKKVRLSYCCDTGFIHVDYLNLIGCCDYIIIESNHNVEMLEESNRPFELITRILSIKGHMSNKMCYDILKTILNDKVKKVYLAHVSEDCNCDKLLYEEVINPLSHNSCEFIIARQYTPCKLVEE